MDMKNKASDYIKSFFKSITIRQWAAIIFMLVAVLVAIIGSLSGAFVFTQTRMLSFLPFINDRVTVINLAPNLISTLIAIILHTLLVIRRGSLRFGNPYEYIILPLNILLCATFIAVLVSDATRIPIIGNIGFNPHVLILFTIIFTAMSMKSIAGFGWILLFLLSFSRINQVSDAMGMWGTIYILSAYISIVFQATNSIGIDFFKSLKDDFMAGTKLVGESMQESGKKIKAGGDAIKKLI